MRFNLAFVLSFLFLKSALALPLSLKKVDVLKNPPPRIIRTCCSFGSEVKVAAIPFLKVSDITSVEKLGNHVYLGSENENNGIIYTAKGGFIDIGHLRDQADWTAYLHQLLSSSFQNEINIELGREGGHKSLEFFNIDNLSQKDKIQLAGNVAYKLSVWHEIATFFGASYVPLVPERYSAFSMEDAFSNLLGVQIGMAALQSNLPFEEAVTVLLSKKLMELEAVLSLEETSTAMEQVRNIWWTREAKLPSKNVLLKREFDIEDCVSPWLINDPSHSLIEQKQICLPSSAVDGTPLDRFYNLNIQLNSKFPVKRLFPKELKRTINQNDFNILIAEAIRKTEVRNNRLKL